MIYQVTKLDQSITIDGNWDKKPWQPIKAMKLKNFMGEKPRHRPLTQVKLGYDDQAIYVIFRVKDRYVLAVTKNYQGRVYEDSCVEFFFTPGEDLNDGYFNLEMNGGGTALFHHQDKQKKNRINIPNRDFQKVLVAHSLPQIVDPEIKDPVIWTVEYRIPYTILRNHSEFVEPATGAKWRANFYKCADNSSHPHWLTWSPVVFPAPNFHLPEYFGELIFQ